MSIGIGYVVKRSGCDGEAKSVGMSSSRYDLVLLQLWVDGNIGTLVNMPVILCAINCQQASETMTCPCELDTLPGTKNSKYN
jgi:hypothetical protein